MTTHDPSLLTAAAALDALEPDENVELDQHLAGCEACRVELAEFRATAARLGSAVAEAPPPSMKIAVMAALDVTRQLPPEVPVATTPAATVPGPPGAAPATVTRIDEPRRRTGTRLLLAAAVATLLAAGALWWTNRTPELTAQEQLKQCVSTAADARPVAASESVGTAIVTVAPSCSGAVVQLTGIPAPPAGHTYQMWVMARDQARSVGTLSLIHI